MRSALIIAGMLAVCLGGCRSADDGQGKAELVSEMESIQPGTPFMAGVRISLPEHWHTYWRNPGDFGMAPKLEWQLPEGFTVGPILWPAPKSFGDPSAVSFGYDGEVLLLQEIRPPVDLVTGRDYTFEVNAAWLICEEVCVPKTGRLQMTLPARAGPPVASAKQQPLFARTKAALPTPDPAWTFRATADSETLFLCVTPPPGAAPADLAKATFYPAQPNLVEYGPQEWTASPGEYCLRMKRISGGEPIPARLEGVLVVPQEKETKALAVDAALEDKGRTP